MSREEKFESCESFNQIKPDFEALTYGGEDLGPCRPAAAAEQKPADEKRLHSV